jgi:DNA-binding response OmpR family regulator
LPRQPIESLAVGQFALDPTAHRVTKDGQVITLSPREFDLLHFFMTHPDQVFTADQIIERVWGVEFIGQTQVLYVQLHGLRFHIEAEPNHPVHLLTLRGVGYKFVA